MKPIENLNNKFQRRTHLIVIDIPQKTWSGQVGFEYNTRSFQLYPSLLA